MEVAPHASYVLMLDYTEPTQPETPDIDEPQTPNTEKPQSPDSNNSVINQSQIQSILISHKQDFIN